MLNIGSSSTGAKVLAAKHDLAKLELTSPVCTKKGEKVKNFPTVVSVELAKYFLASSPNLMEICGNQTKQSRCLTQSSSGQ